MSTTDKGEIFIDMWYNNRFVPKKYGADVRFHPHDPEYCYKGNIYNKDGKKIGDYVAKGSTVVEESFLIEWRA